MTGIVAMVDVYSRVSNQNGECWSLYIKSAYSGIGPSRSEQRYEVDSVNRRQGRDIRRTDARDV
jgi:hypothetical protein